MSILKNPDPPDTPSTPVSTPVSDAGVANNDTKIVLDGPLSNIYTQALNELYRQNVAAEGSAASYVPPQVMLLREMAKDEQHEHSRGDSDKYVYVTSTQAVDDHLDDEVDRLHVALDAQGGDRVVVLECRSPITDHVGAFDHAATTMGARVFYSRKAALEYLKHR